MTIFLNRLIENRSDVQLEQLNEKKIISEFFVIRVFIFNSLAATATQLCDQTFAMPRNSM